MPNRVRTSVDPPRAVESPVGPVGSGSLAGGGAGPSTWYAKRLHLRRQLDGRPLETLRRTSTLVAAPRRTLLFDPAATGDRVWWIEAGRVRLSRFWPDGRETAAAVLEAGEVFGQEPRAPFAVDDAFVEVIESGDFRSVGREDFETALAQHAPFSAALARQIAHQHRMAAPPSWLGSRDVRWPRCRLAELLLLWDPDSPVSALPRMALQELSFLAGLTRPVTIELLAEWSATGAVERSAGQWLLRDRALLESLAAGPR